MQEIHGTGGNRDSILERHTQAFMCTGQGKAETPWESGSDLTAVLGGYPGKTGGDCGLLWGKDIGSKGLRNNHQHELLWGAILEKSPPPPASGLRSPGPAIIRVGTQPHP